MKLCESRGALETDLVLESGGGHRLFLILIDVGAVDLVLINYTYLQQCPLIALPTNRKQINLRRAQLVWTVSSVSVSIVGTFQRSQPHVSGKCR